MTKANPTKPGRGVGCRVWGGVGKRGAAKDRKRSRSACSERGQQKARAGWGGEELLRGGRTCATVSVRNAGAAQKGLVAGEAGMGWIEMRGSLAEGRVDAMSRCRVVRRLQEMGNVRRQLAAAVPICCPHLSVHPTVRMYAQQMLRRRSTLRRVPYLCALKPVCQALRRVRHLAPLWGKGKAQAVQNRGRNE